MTSREKLLVTVLVGVALLAASAVGATLVVDRVAQLEEERASLERMVTRWETQALVNPPAAPGPAREDLESRLWAPGQAPGVIAFSASVQAAAAGARLGVMSFRVVDQGPGRAWVQVQGSGSIVGWLDFVKRLTAGDPQVLFRNVLLKKSEGEGYSYSCEVGYASLP